MSKNERKKAGLHKEISSIFKGVVIPQKEGGKESSIASIPDDTDFAVPSQLAPESRESESPKPYQAAQILPEAETVEEPKIEPIEESRVEPVEEPKVEPVEESRVEPVQETNVEPVHTPKFVMAQESKVIPVEESEIESFKDSKPEPAQENKDKPASPPKFMTAQESKVIPIEESEVEPTQETQDKSVSSPKFVTAKESKVIPVQESEVESTQESEVEPAQRPKNEQAHQGKFKKAKKPKVIPVKESKKTGIDKISKKVSEKRPVVKVKSESSWKQITSKVFTAKPGASATKQKTMVVIMPVLFIVLIIFVFRGGVFGTSVHNAEAGEKKINNSGVAPVALNNQIDWEIPEPYPATLRDPMQLGPVVTGTNQAETKELVKLIVKGILYSEDNSSAIIGNRIVHEGDQIQGANIIKINKDGVKFEMNGEEWTQKVQR